MPGGGGFITLYPPPHRDRLYDFRSMLYQMKQTGREGKLIGSWSHRLIRIGWTPTRPGPYDMGVMRPCAHEPMRLRRHGGKVTVVTTPAAEAVRRLGAEARLVISRLPQEQLKKV